MAGTERDGADEEQPPVRVPERGRLAARGVGVVRQRLLQDDRRDGGADRAADALDDVELGAAVAYLILFEHRERDGEQRQADGAEADAADRARCR